MRKSVNELKTGDIIYQYGIATLQNKDEFIFSKKLTVDNSTWEGKISHKDFAGAYDEHNLRHIIKGNEAVVYRNTLWLSEKDDKLAEKLLLEYFDRKIKIAEHDIELHQNRKELIRSFFN